MTDLISSLADSILALINAKPQSPTKAEIEALVQSQIEGAVLGTHGSYPIIKAPADPVERKQLEREVLTRLLVRQERDRKEAEAALLICKSIMRDESKAELLPPKQTDAEQFAKALREHQAKYTVPTQINTSCPIRRGGGEHTWGADGARCIYCGEKPKP